MGVKLVTWTALVSAALPALAGCTATEADIEAVIAKAGFVYNVPPTTLYGPGVLVFRRNYDPQLAKFTNVQLGPLCLSKYYIDRYPERPYESPTLDTDLRNRLGANVKIGLDAFKRLVGIELNPEIVRDAQISIRHARVLAYSDESLGDIKNLLTPKCLGYVNKNIREKNAYQIDQVLEATIDYTVTFKAKGAASANLDLLGRKIGGTVELVDENTAKISGNALYYGVSLRPLSEPATPQSPPPEVASALR